MDGIEADYLIIGAGAAGMAFTDELISHSDASVVMVDRRHAPGGHWNDAYPFVRLHTPSRTYGVNSRPLGNDTVDQHGPNAGYYERATAAEICDYYQRVMDEQFLPSGQVRFLNMSDYTGEGTDGHRVVSRLAGDETRVNVRRKVVDATYLETAVPATHTPAFTVDPAARLVSPNRLVNLDEAPTGYTILGSGKTAMDTCNWLLDQGVSPGKIRWVRPRDQWILDRGSLQPLEQVASVMEWLSLGLEAAAGASNVDDLFRRLEACGHLHRLDPDVEPTMFRGPILSQAERESLRQVEDVVRLGRVRYIGADRIELEQGTIPTDPRHVHIDCTAAALRDAPARPIFEPGRVTLQPVMAGFLPFSAALLGYIEATRDDDADKNRLSPPNPFPNAAADYMSNIFIMTSAQAEWAKEPDIIEWVEGARMYVSAGARNHMADPRMQAAVQRLATNTEPAMVNLHRMMSEGQPAAAGGPA